ncbi:A/G-specific DNA-adenine glycosylase [Melghirimyces profundicolus]|uniref:Adenine DNA glycosylase n=2 Tax=Melghirimyces profundicolus TaxID=1242148 RepID=A0A2T6BXF6_9BACL|nr:A/G-specific DNA-adenine glycosylase [Melghirimyces profundicolus]
MALKAGDSIPKPDGEWIGAIRRHLLDWYDQNRRDLPWRKNKDPYRIWVSEIMLQQTRVDTVIPYYERFMAHFPTLKALAQADEEEVIKAWEGLGYYSRARNLHSAVKEVVEHYGGEVPSDPDAISRLKGVGPYTAGAILSIAFDRPVPAVDGNVLRVLSRWFALGEDISKVSTRRRMEELDRQLIPEERAGDFNQALMELGALVCTPQSPTCDTCPVRGECRARKEGIQEELPVKKKGKPPVPARVTFGWIRKGDRVLLHRRPSEGLLAGMWGLPTVDHPPEESSPGETLKQTLADQGLTVELGSILGEMEHIFSHRRWYVTLVEALCLGDGGSLPEDCRWVEESEVTAYALPNVYRKAVKIASETPEGIQGRLF